VAVDLASAARVERPGDATAVVVVYIAGGRSMPQRLGGAHSFFLPAAPLSMHKIPSTVQRLILAFTTGLFLACAAHVSAQGDTIPLSSIEP
jgi:hypothetical protein